MKVSGKIEYAVTKSTDELAGPLPDWAIDFNDETTLMNAAIKYRVQLGSGEANREILPSEITTAQHFHVKVRFPAAATGSEHSVGFKLNSDTTAKNALEFLWRGLGNITSVIATNNSSEFAATLDILAVGSGSGSS